MMVRPSLAKVGAPVPTSLLSPSSSGSKFCAIWFTCICEAARLRSRYWLSVPATDGASSSASICRPSRSDCSRISSAAACDSRAARCISCIAWLLSSMPLLNAACWSGRAGEVSGLSGIPAESPPLAILPIFCAALPYISRWVISITCCTVLP